MSYECFHMQAGKNEWSACASLWKSSESSTLSFFFQKKKMILSNWAQMLSALSMGRSSFACFQQTLWKKIQLGDFVFLYEFLLPMCSIPCPSYGFSSFLLPAVRLSCRKPPILQPLGLIFSLPSPFPPLRGQSGLVITGLGCREPSPDWGSCKISAQHASNRGRPRNNVEFLQLSLNGCETLWDPLICLVFIKAHDIRLTVAHFSEFPHVTLVLHPMLPCQYLSPCWVWCVS